MEYYFAEDSGRRNQPTTVIYQQNPVTMICQNGPNSQISIQNSEGIQIGHGNTMVKQMASGENGESPERHPAQGPLGVTGTIGGAGREWGAFNPPKRKSCSQISEVLLCGPP